MHHTINRIVVQGRAGPPTVRLSPEGPIFASTELQLDEHPDVTVTVSGYGIDAAGIAEARSGDLLRVLGTLAFDARSQALYIVADQVRRMVKEGGTLVARAPSMKTFDRFENIFLEHEATRPIS